MLIHKFLATCTLCLSCAAAPLRAQQDARPFAGLFHLRQRSAVIDNGLVVDLGYALYRGVSNTSTGINTWKGIRFAAPPTGANRWQKPLVPATDRSVIMPASTIGSRCPQSFNSNGHPTKNGISGNEDCLFLNVFAPANSSGSLPVMVWIHGGGYGYGSGRQDLTYIMNANNNSFLGVAIQYRLGAFGFLSSQDVFDNGIVNAGMQDQYFALQWIQQYITLFGGDPTRVTIVGESAGGGGVMLLDMAYGGTLGNSLFVGSIAASPYLPIQYTYNDPVPTSNYNAFVEVAGCSSYSGSAFDCLVAASTGALQDASSYVSSNQPFGAWGFLPVTDGTFIQDLPSRQLAAGKVNGQYMLTGNNGIEGSLFVPNNLTTEADVIAWMDLTFPNLTDADVTDILAQYPIQDPNITATSPRFATNGLTAPNANEVSPEGTGQNQRAYNIYSETTFVCPSYWLAEAYMMASNNTNSAGYKYQYSVIPSIHGQDVAGFFNPPAIPHSPDFSLAFKRIFGNFITTYNPSVSNLVANGQSTGNTSVNPASTWPTFNQQTFPMMDLNETSTSTVTVSGRIYPGTGIKNDITLVNAYTWEAGRGGRCEFWRSIGAEVPER